MREDPIIYEDWNIGQTSGTTGRRIQFFDFSISLILCLGLIVWAIYIENAFRVFLWLFTLVLLFFVEIIIDQTLRSIYDRLIVLISIYVELFLTINNAPVLDLVAEIGITVIMLIKLILIPITVTTNSFSKQILVPRNENVSLVLNEHVARLEDTEFRLVGTSEHQDLIFKVNRQILLLFLPGILLGIGLFFLVEILNSPIGELLSIVIIISTGLSFTAVIVIWYLLNRYGKKEQTSPTEELPTFV